MRPDSCIILICQCCDVFTDCNRLPVDDTMSSRDTNDTAMSPGSFQTSYFSHDDTIPDGTSRQL